MIPISAKKITNPIKMGSNSLDRKVKSAYWIDLLLDEKTSLES